MLALVIVATESRLVCRPIALGGTRVSFWSDMEKRKGGGCGQETSADPFDGEFDLALAKRQTFRVLFSVIYSMLFGRWRIFNLSFPGVFPMSVFER